MVKGGFQKGKGGSLGVKTGGNQISKIIGVLNKSGTLQQSISYSDVADSLSALGDQRASQLLQELAAKAHGVTDPTGWLAAAASRSGKGGSKGGSRGKSGSPRANPMNVFSGSMSGGGQLSKLIGRMNKSGILQQSISYSDVAPLLEPLGDAQASQLLDELAVKAHAVADPTGWLSAAASRRAGSGRARGNPSRFPMMNSASSTGGSQISKIIGKVNKMGILQQNISYSDCADLLAQMGERRAVALLEELQGKASGIQDPTGWLCAAASRSGVRAGGPAMSRLPGRSATAGWSSQPVQVEVSKYISKAIGMLNKEGILQAEIQFQEVAPYLCSVPEAVAIDMVKKLKEKASEIKDPTNYLIASAKMKVSKGATGKSELSKKVGELNKKDVLQEKLDWQKVCGPLSLLSGEQAGTLLDELEGKADEIKSPTGYIIAEARKVMRNDAPQQNSVAKKRKAAKADEAAETAEDADEE